MTAAVLSLDHVTKRFGSMTAVNDVSFEVAPGEVLGFLGPNGAGKTTTIRLILGQIAAQMGTIKLFDQPVSLGTNQLHADTGFLGSEMAYEDGLTAWQFLQFADSVRGGGSANRIRGLAERLDLNLSRKIRTLSRGNRQKVGLIAAVMHQPKLLVMDEPTSGFDPLMQQVFAELVQEHVKLGGGVLISSHVLSEVQHLCDRAIFISRGEIQGERSIRELLQNSPREVSLRFTTAAQAQTASTSLTKLKGWTPKAGPKLLVTGTYLGTASPLLTKLASLKPTQCSIREPELDEVFMQFYGQSQSTEKKA